jgi:hypothetical protein
MGSLSGRRWTGDDAASGFDGEDNFGKIGSTIKNIVTLIG